MAHIGAVVGHAGINFDVQPAHDYGVDGTLRHVGFRGNRRVESGLRLDFQAKSTTNWHHKNDLVVYDLESKTYNDLVSREPELGRCVLILLCLPKGHADWLVAAEDQLTLRNCCYWTFLEGKPTGNEESTVRIYIPRTQLFTPAAVDAILGDERARLMSSSCWTN
jgi:hypothetical protein